MTGKVNMKMIFSIGLIFIILIIGCEESTAPNHDPNINSIISFPDPVQVSDSFIVFCSADDVDDDPIFYDWFCTNGGASIKGASPENPYELKNTKKNFMIFIAKDTLQYQTGHATIFCDVRDSEDGINTAWILVGIIR
jgi:hypothetical protein